MIVLMRMTMFPFSIMSYLLGLTSVSFWHYFSGTCAVSLHVIIWLYIGSTLTQFDSTEGADQKPHETSTLERVILMIQILIAFGIGIYISIVAKTQLNKRL